MKIESFQGEYRFLSNFWPCRFHYAGHWYPSVEHAYQALKTIDPDEQSRIRLAPSAGAAKRSGRNVTLREGWDQKKDKIMLRLLREKFSIPDLRAKLLATGDVELIEGNYWGDTYWGKCNGVGVNKLGVLLMQVRREIRDEM